MNGYNFTERVRKVLAMAREEAARLHHEYVGTEHILLGLIREGEGVAATVLQNLSVELDDIQQKIEETVKKGKAGQTTGPDLPYTSRAKKVLELAMSRSARAQSQLRRHRASPAWASPRGKGDCGAGADRRGRQSRRRPRRDTAHPRHGDAAGRRAAAGRHARRAADSAQGREEVQDAGARSLLPRSHAARGRRAARSDDRSRQGNPARDGSAHAPQEEQPGPHRRTRRRQDGDRRGARAAHRQRRVPGVAARPSRAVARHGGRHRRHQVSRPVRGAPQGRHERDRAEQADHPVHRRAAHARRRGRGRRRDRRVQHAEARAGARRAAVRRRVDAQRVSQVHREGRRARAPLPDRDRRSAFGRRDRRDPARAFARSTRTTTRSRFRTSTLVVGVEALGALHHRPVPARQGDRRDRRSGRAGAARGAGAAAGSRRAQGRSREGEHARRKPPFATRTSSAPRRCATRSARSRATSSRSRRSGRSGASRTAPCSARRRSRSSSAGGPAFR